MKTLCIDSGNAPPPNNENISVSNPFEDAPRPYPTAQQTGAAQYPPVSVSRPPQGILIIF